MTESSKSKEQEQAVATKAQTGGSTGSSEAGRKMTAELSTLSKAAEKLRNYDWYLGHDDIPQSTKWTKGGGLAWLTADNDEDNDEKKALPITLALIGQVSTNNFFAGIQGAFDPSLHFSSEELLEEGRPSFVIIPPEYAIDELANIEKDWEIIKANIRLLMAKKEVSAPKEKTSFLKEGGIRMTYDLFKSLMENADKSDEDRRDGCNFDTWPVSGDVGGTDRDWLFNRYKNRLKKSHYIGLPGIYGMAKDTDEQRMPKMKPEEWEAKIKGAIVQVFFTLESVRTVTRSEQRQTFMPKLVHLQVLREAFKPETVGDDVNAILQASPKKKKQIVKD